MLESTVIDRLNRSDVERLVVGYSGGLDSHVLLHAIRHKGVQRPMHALHINHGLNVDADGWQNHCGRVCGDLGVDFTALDVKVSTRGSLEENARNARFEAFERFLASGDLLLLAHHLDDQIETLFFYLFRGNSILGVRGMPGERQLGKGALYRPLLNVPKAEIVRYGKTHGLKWIEDASNADLGLDRNYLRHEVIPRIRSRWPNLDKILCQAIQRDEEALQLVDYLGNFDLDEAMADDGGVALEALGKLPLPRFKNLMRCWIKRLDVPWPSDSLLEEAFATMLASGEDAAPLLTWQGVQLRRFRERIYITNELPEFDRSVSLAYRPGEPIGVAGGTLSAEKVKGQGYSADDPHDLTVRFRAGGERIKLSRSRTLKNLLQERSVPPWLRDRLPLIYRGEELVAVPGLPAWGVPATVASDYGTSDGKAGWIFHFNMDDKPKSD